MSNAKYKYTIQQGDEFGVVESFKAASEVYAPVGGTVTEVNDDLQGNEGIVNSDPQGEGWFMKIELSDTAELENLMGEVRHDTDVRTFLSYLAVGIRHIFFFFFFLLVWDCLSFAFRVRVGSFAFGIFFDRSILTWPTCLVRCPYFSNHLSFQS